MKIDICILGCGRIASFHYKAIINNSKLNLIAVCDFDKKRLKNFKTNKKIKKYICYRQMIRENPNVKICSIMSPSGAHYQHAKFFLNKNIHVVIEKPIVMTISQGNSLKKLAKRKKLKIFPVHQYRFNKCVQRTKKAIDNKQLGKLFLASIKLNWCRDQKYYDRDAWRGTFSYDGGCCTNQGIHHLDLLRYLIGEVETCYAEMSTYGSKIEVEDCAVIVMKFKNGVTGLCEITTAARPKDYESSISILGNKGKAKFGGWATDKLLEFTPNPRDIKKYSDSFKSAYGYGHNNIYKGVTNKLLYNKKEAVSFEDAFETIKLLHSIYKSNEINKKIFLEKKKQSNFLGKKNKYLDKLYK